MKLSGAEKVFRKLRKGLCPGRKAGSGAPTTKRTPLAIEKVKKALAKKEGRSAGGGSIRALAQKTNLRRTTVRDIVEGNLKLKSLAQIKCQRLSAKNRKARPEFRADTLEALESG